MQERANSVRRGHAVVVAAAIILAWTWVPAGIIELGRKGKKKSSSFFSIQIDNEFVDDLGIPNELAEELLDRMMGNFDTSIITIDRIENLDPNGPNRFQVWLTVDGEINSKGDEPEFIEVVVDDPTGIFGGAAIVTGADPGPGFANVFQLVRLVEVSGIGSDPPTPGKVTVIVTKAEGPAVVCTEDTTITPPATALETAQVVMQDLVDCLNGNTAPPSNTGLVVTPKNVIFSNAPIKLVSTGNNQILSVEARADDTLVKIFQVQRGIEPRPRRVPTLGEWGFITLVIMLGGAALLILRRRGIAAG